MLKKSTILIAAILFIATSLYYYWTLAHTYVLPNIDSPFYLLQVNGILKTGGLIYPDPPISFYSFTLFTLLLGNTVPGVTVGSAVFAAAASVAVFFLFRYLFKSNIPALAAALVCTLSAEHLSMSSNLMKNSVGIVFIVCTIFFLQRLLEGETHTKQNILGAVGFFALTTLSHVLDEGIALLFIGFYLVFSLFFTQRKPLLVKYGTILGAAAAMAVSVFLLMPDYFGDLSKGANFVSQVSVQSTVGQGAGGMGMNGPGMGVTDYFIYAILAVGVCLSVYVWVKGDRKKAVLLTSATIMGIALVLPIIPNDYAWRFQLMEFLPASIIVGYACAMIKRRDTLVLAAFLLIVPVALTGFNTASNFSPTISQQSYNDLQTMASKISSTNSMLLVQGGGVAYWPQYILGLPIVSNSTQWLQKGYSVYLLVGSDQGGRQNGNGFNGGVPGGNGGGFAGPGGVGPGQQNGSPGGFNNGGSTNGGLPINSPQNQGGTTIDASNATVIYSGQSYTLYQLKE
jgi:hypothetical protein